MTMGCISSVMPQARKCFSDRLEALAVITPTARSRPTSACAKGTCSKEEVNTGISTALASASWKMAFKPQLVVMARTPSFSSSLASWIISSSSFWLGCRITVSVLAPFTSTSFTGKG